MTVCGYTWDPLDAAVACRQLGFGEALNTYSRSSQKNFGRISRATWKRGLRCTGKENKLIDCQQDFDPEFATLCDSDRYRYFSVAAGVVCKNDSRQTLLEGIVMKLKSFLINAFIL